MALGGLLNQTAAVRDRAVTFPFRLAWTFVLDSLEEAEEDGDNTKEAGGTSDLDGGGGARAGVAAAAAARAAVALGGAGRNVGAGRVALLTTASERTLDGAARLELLESGASIVDVLGGDQSEGTTDVVDLREGSTMICQ